jgi:hypothetical protein
MDLFYAIYLTSYYLFVAPVVPVILLLEEPQIFVKVMIVMVMIKLGFFSDLVVFALRELYFENERKSIVKY